LGQISNIIFLAPKGDITLATHRHYVNVLLSNSTLLVLPF